MYDAACGRQLQVSLDDWSVMIVELPLNHHGLRRRHTALFYESYGDGL